MKSSNKNSDKIKALFLMGFLILTCVVICSLPVSTMGYYSMHPLGFLPGTYQSGGLGGMYVGLQGEPGYSWVPAYSGNTNLPGYPWYPGKYRWTYDPYGVPYNFTQDLYGGYGAGIYGGMYGMYGGGMYGGLYGMYGGGMYGGLMGGIYGPTSWRNPGADLLAMGLYGGWW